MVNVPSCIIRGGEIRNLLSDVHIVLTFHTRVDINNLRSSSLLLLRCGLVDGGDQEMHLRDPNL